MQIYRLKELKNEVSNIGFVYLIIILTVMLAFLIKGIVFTYTTSSIIDKPAKTVNEENLLYED